MIFPNCISSCGNVRRVEFYVKVLAPTIPVARFEGETTTIRVKTQGLVGIWLDLRFFEEEAQGHVVSCVIISAWLEVSPEGWDCLRYCEWKVSMFSIFDTLLLASYIPTVVSCMHGKQSGWSLPNQPASQPVQPSNKLYSYSCTAVAS
jgi:hypothetical protein